jgi:hypothetical protein
MFILKRQGRQQKEKNLDKIWIDLQILFSTFYATTIASSPVYLTGKAKILQ